MDEGQTGGALARILVVEDDVETAEELVAALRQEGYAVAHAERGWQALALLALAEHEPDGPFSVILLDLGLPDLDGIDVCRQARSDGYDAAILIVSARRSELDRVVGLDHGADDYVVKPYSIPEVQARVRALLRRTARAAAAASSAATSVPAAPAGLAGVPLVATATVVAAAVAATAGQVAAPAGDVVPDEPLLLADGVEIDPATRTAVVDGVAVELSGREFDVLRVLAEHAGEPVSRDALLAGAWRAGWVGSAKTLDVTIGRLRTRLEAAGLPGRVVTVRGTGYRLDAAPAAATPAAGATTPM